MRKEDIPERFEFKAKYYSEVEEWINKGGSAIVSPDGKCIAGPLEEEEGIIYAEVDPRQIRGSKRNLDVAGHYARPDVFRLTVSKEHRPVISVAQTLGQELQGEAVALED
jgi:nitrilase